MSYNSDRLKKDLEKLLEIRQEIDHTKSLRRTDSVTDRLRIDVRSQISMDKERGVEAMPKKIKNQAHITCHLNLDNVKMQPLNLKK